MHTEYNYNKYLKKPGTGYSMDRIGTVSLATSTDQGKSWTCHGEIIKSSNPTDPKYWEGKNYWDEARGDPALFMDKDYFYVYYNARWVSRDDPNVCYAGVRVTRCRLADTMAPGKWTKWYQGKWDQPGLGGYDSDVFNENYSDTATVFWSKSRKCYVSIVMSDQKYNRPTGGWEYDGSISTCTDLGKQDWTKPIQVCDKARKGYYTWVIDPKTRSRYVMESDTFRWCGTENRCRALVVTLTNAPVHPVARLPLYPPESVDDHNPGWDRSFAPPASLKSQPTAKTSQAKVGPNPSPWSNYRFAPDAIQEIDLASDTAWSLSIDGGAERPIKVPAGGWNSERQEPRIDTWTGVKDHVIYRTKLVIPADASGRCVKLLLGSVNFGAEILIDGQKVGEHAGCMTPIALDITKVVTSGKIHDLQVKAFHRKHYGHPLCSMPVGFDVPAGCGIEGQGQTKYGYGINGYARLAVYPLVQIEDVFVRPSVSMQTLAFDVWIANRSLRRATVTLKGSLSRWSKSKVSHGRYFAYPALPSQTIEIPAGETRKVTVAKVPWLLGAESYWWPNMPYRADYQAALHWLNLSVTEAGCVLHERKERFGFVEHAEGPFYYTVNGVRYTSISDSISHGQVGNYDCFYETTCFQPADGKILGCPETWRRYQRIGFNTLRTSTSVPSPYMLETADEAGYLLIPEGGNWYHEYSQYHPVNTPRQLQDTLLACRNHPCVARYSLANESITSKTADSPDLGWRRLIDAALEIDDTRPYVFEELPGYVSTGIVQGMKQGHAYRMQHYDPIGQGGDRLRGMGELCWETDGMEALAVGVPALRLKDWTHFAPWSWVNYWPNFLEGMSHDRHPWTQNNHADRHDGVDGWGSPIVTAIQRAFHPFLVVDTNTLNLNPAIKKYSLDITAAGPRPAPSYSAGSDFRREFQVFNGALARKTLKLRWTARWDRPDGPKAAQGSVGPFEIEPGFHKPQTVEFKVPMPGRENRILFLVLESIRDGKVVYREDRLCFTVTTPSHQSELLRELTAASLPQAQLTTVRPHEIEIPLVNPFCGWGLWAGPRFYDSRPFSVEYNTKGFGDDAPLFSWVLIDWMWADLEPEEGQYAWNDLDTVVEYWKARGKQLIVRLWVTTDPGWAGAPGNKTCPDWLWDAGVKYHEYKAEGGVKQRCPAYADPTWETLYLPKMKRFLSAYRDRYHKPGGPVVLDYVMGFGDWGEWHTMWSHYPWPSREKKREVLGKAINAYLEVFAPKQPEKEPVRSLAIAHVYDDDCGGNTPLAEAMRRQALDLAAARGFAFARNGFIDGLGGWPNDLSTC